MVTETEQFENLWRRHAEAGSVDCDSQVEGSIDFPPEALEPGADPPGRADCRVRLKGNASFFDLADGSGGAGRGLDHPGRKLAAADIEDYVAFCPPVRIET